MSRDEIYGANERYELIAELYHNRFGELAPGKDRPAAMGAQSEEDRKANSRKWSRYLDDLAFKDLETEVLNLRAELAELQKDSGRLEFLETKDISGHGWTIRHSTTGRGFRIHTSHPRDMEGIRGGTLRQTIDEAMDHEGHESGT